MSSDEDDYMSASFIVDCSSAKDVRPGLLHNRNQQRSHEIFKKKQVQDAETREQHRPIKVIEAQRREEGLQEAIGTGNKGFALLQKMGYKPGTAIGKSGTGSVVPIPLLLKTDRQGLGRSAALEELKEAKRLIRAKRQESAKSEVVSIEEFRARLSQKSVQRLVEIDLFKSQKGCHQLDVEGGYTEPAETWFWPKSTLNKKSAKDPKETEDGEISSVESTSKSESEPEYSIENESDEEEEDEFEASEKLEMLTKYLRSTHNYCVWCCVKFDDEKDMQSECPGPTREDH